MGLEEGADWRAGVRVPDYEHGVVASVGSNYPVLVITAQD